MATDGGRAPRPKGGDPNAKMMRLSLTPEEWRKLRVWAAEADASVEAIVGAILRRELDRKPRRTI
jgi:plasmid stability protein